MGFSGFFEQATEGRTAFAFQRLIAEADTLPLVIDVPTGAGKTAAAVLGWLWRRQMHPSDPVRHATPRRLVYCLPMRTLVEQTVEAARTWLGNLDLLATGPQDVGKVGVYQLMGGEVTNDWDAAPEADAILVGTQDQLLSRALNRGYALSRYRWPMHFGLLNSDSLWVMDEIQLMGPGLPTSVQLQAFRDALGAFHPVQSLWMSATVRHSDLLTIDGPTIESLQARTLGLTAEDATHPVLSERLTAAKPLDRSSLALDTESAKTYPGELAAQVLDAHAPASLTLVVLNQVARAQAVFRALDKLPEAGAVDRLLVHSRFRPAERRELRARLSADVPPEGRIVVATQAVEAGVDISARALFTELAPWPSLVQRFGRCNRYGEWSEAQCRVRWIDITEPRECSPYEPESLDLARGIVEKLDDVGLTSLRGIADPTPAAVTQVIRRRDVIDLFDTTPDLAGNDMDISPFIRESEDSDVSVLWRDLTDEAAEQLAPSPDELCPVRLPAFRDFLAVAQKRESPCRIWDGLNRRWAHLNREDLRPGIVALVDHKGGGYDPRLGWWPGATQTPPVIDVTRSAPETTPVEGFDDDHLTHAGRYVPLTEHLDDVRVAVEELEATIPDAPGMRESLFEAATWHDLGKAHPYFQQLLVAHLPGDDQRRTAGPWAKSDTRAKRDTERPARPHFRHELASALAMLTHGCSDLAAYLAAAHHGKVRMSIRSLPGEHWPENGGRFARGVWEGDVLPAADIGGGKRAPETVLSLELMDIGGQHGRPSWIERTLTLLQEFGPFRLAYLEALLRVADWRASARERDGNE